MRIDPRHLRVVLAIAKHGTFNRAAIALNMSQPALSKSVSLLERSLGVRLFDRGKQGTSLTEAGRVVLRSAHNVENSLQNVQAELEAHRLGLAGTLVVGATPSMLFGIVPQALSQFAQKYPNINIRIEEGLESHLIPALRKGEVELLLGPINTSSDIADITEIPVMRESFFIAVPAHHKLTRVKQARIAELDEDAWILPSPGSSFYHIAEALFIAAGKQLPKNAIITNSLQMQEQLIRSTGRLCLITPVQFLGRKTPFHLTPLADAPDRMLGIRHLRNSQLSALAQEFIPCVRNVFQEQDHTTI